MRAPPRPRSAEEICNHARAVSCVFPVEHGTAPDRSGRDASPRHHRVLDTARARMTGLCRGRRALMTFAAVTAAEDIVFDALGCGDFRIVANVSFATGTIEMDRDYARQADDVALQVGILARIVRIPEVQFGDCSSAKRRRSDVLVRATHHT
jgi:hypothetical protein